MTTRNTTTTTLTEQVATEEKSAPAKSTFDIAVAKIMEETGRPECEAIAGLRFIETMVDKARTGARSCDTIGTHHLTYQEMATTGYEVMDAIMQHGIVAQEGSAHAAVEGHVLGPNEYGLVHANPTGLKQDCQVALGIHRLS